MNLFVDPVSATVAGWQFFGKAVEQQLRVSRAVNRAFLAPFAVMPLNVAAATENQAPDFTSKRVEASPAKPKPVARRRAAKPAPKTTKRVVAEVKSEPKPAPQKVAAAEKPNTEATPSKPAAKKAVAQSQPAKADPAVAKTPAPTAAPRGEPRRPRQPSKPPVMPEAIKK